jgi:hypothetical protein
MIQHILKDVLSKKIKLVFRKPLKIFCEWQIKQSVLSFDAF